MNSARSSNCARSRIVNRRIFRACWVKLDGREALNLLRDIICGRINFRNCDFLRVASGWRCRVERALHILAQDWSNQISMSRSLKSTDSTLRFAMTAPWSIELDQNIFLVVKHDVFVVLRNNHHHRSFLLLRDGLGLDAGFDLAINVVLHELAHLLFGEVPLRSKGNFWFLTVSWMAKAGHLPTSRFRFPACAPKCFGVNCCKINLALVLLSERLELSGELCALLGCFCEDVGKRNAGLGYSSLAT